MGTHKVVEPERVVTDLGQQRLLDQVVQRILDVAVGFSRDRRRHRHAERAGLPRAQPVEPRLPFRKLHIGPVEQLAEAQVWVQRHVAGYRFRTLALPHGVYPKDLAWAISGEAKGSAYRHDAIMMVAGGAAPSPYARAFDPYRLPRIQAVERDLTYWLQHFERNPQDRLVSDGDPATLTIPAAQRAKLRADLPKHLKLIER